MLTSLRIQNIAIAENLEIDLSAGLNILTGQTGAGKSIILKSIELLTGRKTSANIIRAGGDKAVVEGLFTLSPELRETLKNEFEELDEFLADDEQELLIRRILDKSGRSKFYLNGSLFTHGVISRISPFLIEITGQHDQQNLRFSNYHREILDGFGTPEKLLKEVHAAFSAYKEKHDLYKKLVDSKDELILKLERLKNDHAELVKLDLTNGEKDKLESEIERVKHFDKIRLGLEEANSYLENDDTGLTPYNLISKVYSTLSPLARFDDSLNNCLETAQQTLTCLSELGSQTEDLLQSLDFDAEKFDESKIRLGLIKQYERKFNRDSESLIEYTRQLEDEINSLESNFLDEKSIAEEVNRLKAALQILEEKLTLARVQSSKKLNSKVLSDLKELDMPKARFEIKISKKESSSNGADDVTFMFSANPGENLQPLETVASGGELSRIQLILKSLSSSNRNMSLQVFDEIDSGVSGAVSQSVGEKLLSLAKNSQVIAITHSAQIAALADHHLLVEKEVIGERTFSKISLLNKESRLNVIAAMLAGKNVTKEFLNSAAQLLEIRSEKNLS